MHPFDLHKDVDAFRLWFTSLARNTKSDNEDIIGSGLVVNQMYTVSLEKKGRFVIKRLEFIISANAQFLPSTEAETAIVDTFCWLHSAVIPLSLTPEFNEDIHDSESHQMPPVRKPTNLLEFAIHQERRFLPRCMLALATGKRSFNDIDKINPDHQGQVFSAMLATDLIVRALDSRKSIGVAVSLLSYQLENASQTQFHDLLSRMNLSTSRTTELRHRAQEALKLMKQRLVLSPHALLLLSGDNVQWKDGLGQYIHYCVFLHHNPPINDLPYENLPRKRLDWEQFVGGKEPKDVLDEVFRANQADYNTFGECVLTHIQAVVNSYETLPTVAECEELIEGPVYTYTTSKKLPVLHRLSRKGDLALLSNTTTQEEQNGESSGDDPDGNPDVDLDGDLDGDPDVDLDGDLDGDPDVDLDVDPDGDPDVDLDVDPDGDLATIWRRNHMFPCPAIPLNFSASETMHEILAYMLRVADQQIAEATEAAAADSDKEPPISNDCVFFVGDGAPVEMIGRLLDDDTDGELKKVLVFLGVFHFKMEVFKKANSLNEELARYLASTFYGQEGRDATDTNLTYFLRFNDPTRPEKEIVAVITAIYAYVIRCMRKQGQVGVTAVSIHNWMIERAKESPLALAFLSLVLHYELVLLVRSSERRNDLDMFFTTVRLSLPLFCDTHATCYVRICCDMLRNWKVWSDLERRLIRDRCFTVESESGQRIGVDYSHEKYVNLIREKTGKVHRRGHEAKIEHAAVARVGHANDGDIKHAMSNLQEGGGKCYIAMDRSTVFTNSKEAVKAFAHVTVLLEETKVFEVGLSAAETDDKRLVSAKNSQPLNSDVLMPRSIGESRYDKYAERYYISTQNQVIRHEKDMGLKAIDGSCKKVKESMEIRLKRAVSLEEKELLASGTKEELYAEFAKLEPYLSRLQKEKVPKLTPTALKSTNKRIIVTALISLRKPAFLRNPDAKKALEEMVREASEGSGTSRESREAELERKFYTFGDCPAKSDVAFNTWAE
jgi:hypothetical protein